MSIKSILTTDWTKTTFTTISFFFILFACSNIAAQNTPILNPSACGLGIEIPDSSCNATNRFPIQVAAIQGTALGTDVYLSEVRLIIAHSWLADLDISLISPNGISVELSSDNGEDEDNYGDPSDVTCGSYVSFTVNACRPIEGDTITPFVGAYQPEGNFADFNDGSNPNGQWFLQICDDAGDDTGRLEFVELVFSSIACIAPINLEEIQVDSTTIMLDWSSNSDCNNAIIEYGAVGFTPGLGASAGEGTMVQAACPPFNLVGLDEYTTYEIYVREACGADTYSSNSCSILASTSCLPPPISLVETFNQQSDCINVCGQPCDIVGTWSNTFDTDSFDWTTESGATLSSNTGPDGDVEGNGNYVYIETSGSFCRSGRDAHLVSNCIQIDTTGSSDCHFSFDYHMFGGTIRSLLLEVSDNGGSTWTTIWEQSGNQGNQWLKQYINLSEWHEQIVQFRFVGKGGASATGDIALDNLVFYGSTDVGTPTNQYFADSDNDGFGDANNAINSCYSTAPDGFVTNDLDCNDNDAAINPDALEITCNGIDENCNGMEDDAALNAPITRDTSVCEGQMATVFAEAPAEGFILWYASAAGSDLLAFDNEGEGYSVMTAPGMDSIVVYAEAWIGFDCTSAERSRAVIYVNALPQLTVGNAPTVCTDEAIQLDEIPVVDEANLNGTITYHTNLPATSSNQLNNFTVIPTTNLTYYVASTTAAGCQTTALIDIKAGSSPAVNIAPSDTVVVCAGADQTLRALSFDPDSSYNYLWSNGAVSQDITFETSSVIGTVETFTLTVTDDIGCTKLDTTWIRTSAGIGSARIVPSEVTTCGGDDGAILVEPLTGTAPFSYTWQGKENGSVRNIDGAFTIPNLSQGTYKISIVDNSSLSCSIQLPFTLVNGPSARVSVASTKMVSCADGNDGEICLEVSGINPLIVWDDGSNEACLSNLSSGTYSVTVFDGDCASVIEDIEIKQPDPIVITQNLTAPTCADRTDGEIDLTTAGGTAPYTHFWNDSSNFEDRTDLAADDYLVSIVDFNNCTFSDTISLLAPDSLQILDLGIRNISCTDENDAAIDAQIIGGTTPYFYNWEDGQRTSNIDNLAAGSYTLTASDANGCNAINTFQIQQPQPLSIQLDSIQNASCEGVNDGNIQVTGRGGTGDYGFSWSNGASSADNENIRSGTYILTLIDENGCEVIDSFRVDAPAALSLTANITSPTCIGSPDGSITLDVMGGNENAYLWNDSTTTTSRTAIVNGTYSVTITDENGCVLDSTFQVEAPQVFDTNIATRSPSCFDSADGSIQLNVTNQNGLPPDFEWSNGSTAQNLTDISSGNYQVIITDADGCQLMSDTIIVEAPDSIGIIVKKVTPVQCANEMSGSIEVEVFGGAAPYEYSWNTLDTTQSLFDIGAGLYRLAVLDQNSCAVESDLLQVEQPDPIQLGYEIIQNEICQLENESVDSLKLSIEGGTMPYRFSWSNGDTTANIQNLEAGDYSVTVSDQNGCSASIPSIKVKPSASGFFIKTLKQNVSCPNANDGDIFATVRGGTPPYLYHLSDGNITTQNTDTLRFSNLVSGNYDLSITDDFGCTTTARNIFIAEPEAINILLNDGGVQQVSCKDGADGEIDVTVEGGRMPYTFTWVDSNDSIVSQTEDLENARAGQYRLLVEDSNGCQSVSRNYIVRSPASPITFSSISITDATCFGESNGSISLNVTGGTPPYEFDWNNGFFPLRNLPNISAGFYTLEVKDGNGCMAQLDSLEVRQANRPIQIQESIIRAASCSDSNDGSIEVALQGGIPPYQLFWQSTDPRNNYINGNVNLVDDLIQGNYELIVTDSLACRKVFDFVVDAPAALTIRATSTPTTQGETTGTATAEVEGGTLPYRYQWSVAESPDTVTLLNLGVGLYNVTVTDARDCATSATIEVQLDTVNSTFNTTNDFKFELFPNPSSGEIQLILPNSLPSKELKVNIYNNIGQLLEQRQQRIQTIIPINLSDWTAGNYWIQLITEDGEFGVQQLIILR